MLRFTFALAVLLPALPAGAIDLFNGRVNIHGSVETQLRAINQDFSHETDLTMWRLRNELEIEAHILDESIGILDMVTAFVRLDTSYDCVWTRACTLFPSANAYGNRLGKSAKPYRNGRRNGFVGSDPTVNPVNPRTPYHPSSRPVGIGDTPPFEILSLNTSFATTFAPFLDYEFLVRQNDVTTSFGDSSGLDALVQIPQPKDDIVNRAGLARVPNVSTPALPYRPAIAPVPGSSSVQPVGLFNPSEPLRELIGRRDIDHFDQNFDLSELAFNLGASQEKLGPLREAYLDIEMFDSRLFLRVGRQTIVWGKTELFRNQDLLNPEDLSLVTLPGLEESRIPVWSARGIWSFYDVGPLQDVRLELAWIFDEFEPTDVGRCGEPYSPIPVCNKAFGLFQHGLLGLGLAGETRPPNGWQDLSGHEIGGRLEFRYGAFSFAISDFWHYEDFAHPELFHGYDRRVDPLSGRPLSVKAGPNSRCPTGIEPGCLLPGNTGPNNAFADTSLNRQLFDVICSSSVGFFALDPASCAVTVTNSMAPIGGGATLSELVSAIAGGNPNAAFLAGLLLPTAPPVLALNADPCDSFLEDCVALGGGAGTPAPGMGFFTTLAIPFGIQPTLQEVLTDPQEALLGCGPFYAISCDVTGADLFNTEASVLLQSWPGAIPGAPVATRFFGGTLVQLPGSRGPTDAGYNPLIDGCVGPLPPALDPMGACAASTPLIDPRTGMLFSSEMAALSYNALLFVVALDLLEVDTPPGCAFPTAADPTAPLQCPTVQDFFSVSATTLPVTKAGGNGRFGRRDFAWAGAGEVVLDYARVNTLGLAMDFAEDRTQTAWAFELTWTDDKPFTDTSVKDLRSEADVYALTVSVDRPTFVRFLNPNRTFFINMQWFLQYVSGYRGGGGRSNHRGFVEPGPFTALGTLTLQTSYFQDRLSPSVTGVYDVRTGSGAALWQLTYRYTANLSVSLGVNYFFGKGHGQQTPIGLGAVGESNQKFRTERFPSLTAVRERDEMYLVLRYSF